MNQTDIESHYRTMSDHQLILLFQNESHSLTPQARRALQKEMESRQLTPDNEASHQPSLVAAYNFDATASHILQYVMEQKTNGASDAFITGGLLERGMEEEDINLLLSHFNGYLQQKKEKMNRIIMTGTLQWVSGIALLQLPLNRQQHLSILIIAYAMLGLGLMRTAHGYFNKRKISKAEPSQPVKP